MVAITVDDVSKMKVADLKKELEALGLSTDGKKNELQERLEEALTAEEDVEESEDSPSKGTKRKSVEFSGNDEVVEPEEPVISKYESITAPAAEAETKVKTAQELSDEAKIAARVARWGLVEPPAKKQKESASETKENKKEKKENKRGPKIKMAAEDIDIEKLKSRAARFGDACPKDLTVLEKKAERAERFKNGTSDQDTNGKVEEAVTEAES